jgi:putative endonuclease
MARNQRIGTWGEQAASDYLRARGFEILDRNVRTPYGEIDLLALRDRQTIFVEVKTRTSRTLGPPEISVSPRKQAHMIACAEYHAQQQQIDHWRIDVVAVERVGGQVRIIHFENAVS